MTSSDERFPISAAEDNALPSLDGAVPEDQPIGEAEDRQHSPIDRPRTVEDWGTTASEVRDGEPLSGRLAREEPDTTVEPYPVDAAGREREPDAGRLVAPDEGAHEDTEKDVVANDVGRDRGGRSAEEAAMHITEDIPGGSWSSGEY